MELYAAVRRSVYVEGWSERAAARRFGLARETVRKMLRYRLPPGYRRAQPIRRPKLDAFTGIIDQILREDQPRPKKQRHTAKRIGERLRAEYGFTGGDTIVKAYVREQRLGGQEMFVPLAHPSGDAQADFGDALVVIAGVECKAHYLVVDLPHGIVRLIRLDPKNLQSRTIRLQVDATRPGGGSALFENVAAIEMALVVEMVVDRGMDGGECLQGLDVSEPSHCPFPPSKGLM